MDYDDMQQFVCGIMGHTPNTFWQLTIQEYDNMIEGYLDRLRREREGRAEQALWIMSPHLDKKSTITVKDLLGEDAKDNKKKSNTESDYHNLRDEF